MDSLILDNKNGMKAFTLVWFGQLISLMGTAMTKFALMVWAYEQTGKASTTALLGFFAVLPAVIFGAFSGVAVDKFSKKKLLIYSDICFIASGFIMLALYSSGTLRIWHLYAVEALSGFLGSLTGPAFTSAITLMIPKDKYSRASGMRSFSNYASQIFAPVLGGFLVLQIGFKGVMIVDIVTFLASIGAVAAVRIPQMRSRKAEKEKNLSEDVKLGFRYILERRGLFELLIIFTAVNFLAGLTYFGILPAMILARTGGDKMVLAGVQAALGLGGVIGSIVISVWKGPKKQINMILIATALSFLIGDTFLASNAGKYVWYGAAFVSSFFIPILVAGQTTIWQSKVEPSVQGRVFSIKGICQEGLAPLGYIMGGFLADYFFEPVMSGHGTLNRLFGWYVGTENGSGMAFMFLCSGVIGTVICLSGYLLKSLRKVESDLPDFDEQLPEAEEA
ncbi:MAG: MFS transporter [Bacillota bacterium]|nr:MFS transporter [Bacillota bacterium]